MHPVASPFLIALASELSVLATDAKADLALVVSICAFWVTHRASRRQKEAEAPRLAFTRGRETNTIAVTNCGCTAACQVQLKTQEGAFIKWSNQYNEILWMQDSGGGLVGADLPWSNNCAGETRTIEPNGRATVVVAADVGADEVLSVAYRDYRGRRIKMRKALRRIYAE